MEQGFYKENSTVYYYAGYEKPATSVSCYKIIGYDFDSNTYKYKYPIPKLHIFKNKSSKIEIEHWTKRMKAIEFLDFVSELNEDNRKYTFNTWKKGLDHVKKNT